MFIFAKKRKIKKLKKNNNKKIKIKYNISCKTFRNNKNYFKKLRKKK